MSETISRRDFLKLGGLALGGFLINSAFTRSGTTLPDGRFDLDFPYQEDQDQGKLMRVAIKQIDLRAKPNDDSDIIGNRFRDQLVHIYEEVTPNDAPEYYNPLWYKVWGGYLHSAHLQLVRIQINEPASIVPESGILAEITVPFTTAYQFNDRDGWYPWRGSRLYYDTVHWITGIETGPDREPWYQITSELSKAEKYYAPAKHMRVIPPQEYSPLSTEVPAEGKRVEVSLSEQILRAYENDQEVFSTKISSGIPTARLGPNALPTATPKGRFRIYAKQPSKHMGSITGNPDAEANGGFSLPGVPWTSFFASPGGYAFHGTYWHNNFGLQMSHGCINMRNEDAKWLFRWSTPTYDQKIESPTDWERRGNGTAVHVF
jgi:lipoprotein-anchoring transpeptidase ErfK/SrfK